VDFPSGEIDEMAVMDIGFNTKNGFGQKYELSFFHLEKRSDLIHILLNLFSGSRVARDYKCNDRGVWSCSKWQKGLFI